MLRAAADERLSVDRLQQTVALQVPVIELLVTFGLIPNVFILSSPSFRLIAEHWDLSFNPAKPESCSYFITTFSVNSPPNSPSRGTQSQARAAGSPSWLHWGSHDQATTPCASAAQQTAPGLLQAYPACAGPKSLVIQAR